MTNFISAYSHLTRSEKAVIIIISVLRAVSFSHMETDLCRVFAVTVNMAL